MLIPSPVLVRDIERADFDAWQPLWAGYDAFYGRKGGTALSTEVRRTTWQRFFDPHEPLIALLAAAEDRLVGLAHLLCHRSTTRIEPHRTSALVAGMDYARR